MQTIYDIEEIKFATLDELQDKLDFLDKYWKVVRLDDTVLICNIICKPHPKINLSVNIDNSCRVHAFVGAAEMHNLGNYKVPRALC